MAWKKEYVQLSEDQYFEEGTVVAFDGEASPDLRYMTQAEIAAVREEGRKFAGNKSSWLLINGRFTSGFGDGCTDVRVRNLLRLVYGYPQPPKLEIAPKPPSPEGASGGAKRSCTSESITPAAGALEPKDGTLKVLLDSPGGSLDSAYVTVLYLRAYVKNLEVYVPNRAKSASTLLAVGADRAYLSAFGELGPLDTQIPDPRNPTTDVSALDCYQSVDYVREFGFKTISKLLPQLILSTERQIPVSALLDTASTFALRSVEPILKSIKALDFGGWGRSLKIGEHYARKLLQIKAADPERVSPSYLSANHIAHELVYGYPHHLFPIDYREASRLGLEVEWMNGGMYEAAIRVLEACQHKDFVGFLSEAEQDKERASEGDQALRWPADGLRGPQAADRGSRAEAGQEQRGQAERAPEPRKRVGRSSKVQ